MSLFGTFFELMCGPRGIAAAVAAKNMPPACFLNASTVLQALMLLPGSPIPDDEPVKTSDSRLFLCTLTNLLGFPTIISTQFQPALYCIKVNYRL